MNSSECGWVEAQLEQHEFEDWTDADRARFESHQSNCPHCQALVAGFEEVDRRVRVLYRTEVARATQRPRVRPSAVSIGFGALTAAALALFMTPAPVIDIPVGAPPAEVAVSAGAPETPAAAPVEKGLDLPEGRSKPGRDAASTVPPTERSAEPDRSRSSNPLQVTDQAGYGHSLDSFRGKTLILGVIDPQDSRSVRAFQKIYEVFGGDSSFRVLGVLEARGPRPPDSTFPLAFNQGSALLGASTSEFVVVDVNGVFRHRGSLLADDAETLNSIRSVIR